MFPGQQSRKSNLKNHRVIVRDGHRGPATPTLQQTTYFADTRNPHRGWSPMFYPTVLSLWKTIYVFYTHSFNLPKSQSLMLLPPVLVIQHCLKRKVFPDFMIFLYSKLPVWFFNRFSKWRATLQSQHGSELLHPPQALKKAQLPSAWCRGNRQGQTTSNRPIIQL